MILSNNIVKQILGIALMTVFYWSCNTDAKSKVSETNQETLAVAEDADPDCVDFIALWSSGDIAEKIGKNRKWVFLNYTVDLWDTPPTQGNGNIVGKLRASSYARIVAIIGDDYKVESPMDQVHGWLNKEHIKTISRKNPKTRALCE